MFIGNEISSYLQFGKEGTAINAQQLAEHFREMYKYKKLDAFQSDYARKTYEAELPDFLKGRTGGSDMPLYAENGQLVCNGFERIVIGDYGAYVEFNDEQANLNHIITMPGQEYRQNDSYSCKFLALTLDGYKNEISKDIYGKHSLLIYKQTNTVPYADYKVGKYYVSVYQIKEG